MVAVDVYNTIRERLFDSDSNPDYTETRQGGGIRIGPRFSDIWSLLFNYSYAGTNWVHRTIGRVNGNFCSIAGLARYSKILFPRCG